MIYGLPETFGKHKITKTKRTNLRKQRKHNTCEKQKQQKTTTTNQETTESTKPLKHQKNNKTKPDSTTDQPTGPARIP